MPFAQPQDGSALYQRSYHPRSSKKYTNPFQYWAPIVERCFRGRLSVSGADLVALAVIAVGMRRLIDENIYLGGLWRRSLLHELLWGTNETSFRPKGIFRAPTWSWASVEAANSYKECWLSTSYEWRQVLATVKDVYIDRPVLHGHVTSSSLTLGYHIGVITCKRRRPRLKRRDSLFTDITDWTGE